MYCLMCGQEQFNQEYFTTKSAYKSNPGVTQDSNNWVVNTTPDRPAQDYTYWLLDAALRPTCVDCFMTQAHGLPFFACSICITLLSQICTPSPANTTGFNFAQKCRNRRTQDTPLLDLICSNTKQIHTQTHICTHIHTHTYTNTHVHAHTYSHTH